MVICWDIYLYLVGGIPTLLKNDGLRQLGWLFNSQLNGKSFNPFHGSSHHQPVMVYIHIFLQSGASLWRSNIHGSIDPFFSGPWWPSRRGRSLQHWTVLEVHPMVDTLALSMGATTSQGLWIGWPNWVHSDKNWPIGINPCSFTEFHWWIVIVIVVVIVIESVSRQSIVIVLACYSFMVHPAPPMVPTNPGFPLKTSGPMGLVQAGPILIPIKSHDNPFTCPSNSHSNPIKSH